MHLIDIIPVGAEHAVPAKRLASLAGCKSVRELQHELHNLRCRGAVICSTTENGGGYYQPANEQELRQFVRSMRSRAKKIKQAIRAAEKMLDKSVQGG